MEENRHGKPRHGRGSPWAWGRRNKGQRLDSLLPDPPTRRIPGARCLDQAPPISMPGGPGLASRPPIRAFAGDEHRVEPPLLPPPSPPLHGSPSRTLGLSRPLRLFDPLRETFHSPSRSLGSSRRIRPSPTSVYRSAPPPRGRYIGRAAARTSSPIGNVEAVRLRLRLLPAHFKIACSCSLPAACMRWRRVVEHIFRCTRICVRLRGRWRRRAAHPSEMGWRRRRWTGVWGRGVGLCLELGKVGLERMTDG